MTPITSSQVGGAFSHIGWCERDESLTWWWQDNRRSGNSNLLFWERQVSVAPKNVYKPSIFFFLHHFLLALAVNKSPAVYVLSPALDGLWTGTRRLKTFPWDALVYGSIMAFYLNLEKLGKPERCVMLWASMSRLPVWVGLLWVGLFLPNPHLFFASSLSSTLFDSCYAS